MTCLETLHLSHHFAGGQVVLRDINLSVPQGSIYGFLGPNGAGKTTTLRLLLGLLKKQQGSIHLFGEEFDTHRRTLLQRIGSFIESPSLYGHLTARDNLVIFQKIYGCPRSNIDRVLSLVGLAGTGRKKASQFSLGMKQRLGIAIALLHNPELLILDEPTNGLDPNGIIEMRSLLKNLNQQHGTTIVVSSHLLAEIEKLVTHLAVIHQGTLRFQGTLNELKLQQQHAATLVLGTGNPEAALQLLHAQQVNARYHNDRLTLPTMSNDEIAAINRTLVHAGIDVYELRHTHNDLESIFMNLVNN